MDGMGFAGRLGAPAIVGSMQGRFGDGVTRDAALAQLRTALEELGEQAQAYGVPLLFEPLNRYETNLINKLADGVALLRSLRTRNVKLLADLFHMNIEESDLAGALRDAAGFIGHVHLADSNRRPAGNGHTDFGPIARRVIVAAAPGPVVADPATLPFAKLRPGLRLRPGANNS